MVLNLNENWEITEKPEVPMLWTGTVSIRINGVEKKKANIWNRDSGGMLRLLKLYSDWLETESGNRLVPINLENTENNYILNLKTKNYE